MIDLASPYSHPDPAVRHERRRVAASLLRTCHAVFSLIAHGHPLVEHGLPTHWGFWERFAREHLERCDEVVVLMLDGWQESAGVKAEVRIAGELGKPVCLATTTPTLAHVGRGTPGWPAGRPTTKRPDVSNVGRLGGSTGM